MARRRNFSRRSIRRPASLLRRRGDYILRNAAALQITKLLDRDVLRQLYEDPFHNSRVPDFIAVTNHGVICTGGSKLAEHGGFSHDDRNVALLLSARHLAPGRRDDRLHHADRADDP